MPLYTSWSQRQNWLVIITKVFLSVYLPQRKFIMFKHVLGDADVFP